MTYYCTYCGTPIDENTGVCPYCGAAYTIPTQVYTEVKKRKFPVTAVAIIAVLLVAAVVTTLLIGAMVGMFTLSGSVVHNEAVTENVESVTTEDESIMSEVEAEKENSTLALTPEEAVDIYMANKDVWMFEGEVATDLLSLFYEDLNFDGVLELCVKVQMSGWTMSPVIFTINIEDRTVERFTVGGMSSGLSAYENKNDGLRFYLISSFQPESPLAGLRTTKKVYSEGDELRMEEIYGSYTTSISGERNEYYIYISGERRVVTEDEYNRWIEEFEIDNVKLEITQEIIDAKDFDDASFDSQREQLLEAYRSFSYDGFSFED